jgi:Cu2+-exporting ATPase
MEGKSWVYVAEGGELAGVIELDACVRPEAREVLDELKASGIRLYIISGDTEAPTKRLADALGVDGYFANVLPMTKAELVKQLKADGRKVGFVGDGINDAIALREADVSVSFRSATSVASDNAQIVLMSDSLHELQILFKVAKTFNKTLSHNLHRSLALSPVGVAAAIFLPYKFLIVHSLYIGNLVIGFFVATRPLLAKNSENKAVTNNTQKRIEYKLTDKAQA